MGRRTVEVVAYTNCPRCGTEVVSIGLYGDRTRHDVHDQLIDDGVPDNARFMLEPCGDIIGASQVRLRRHGTIVDITFCE